ncbi:baseplate hub protein [Fimbriiglobus ruber]|uniref:Phage protein n=1 Tax=Fimbriiglobus ruber TaxID=1908690 RepID=A0A225DMG4_9BACT|nr:hypothetical protein [Fimbriiglobus ruber]OWK42203.1 Phage protein [Fimbriiglobus ruber]
MTSAFDGRLVSATLTLLSGPVTFQSVAIFARGRMFANAQAGQCELAIYNMTKDQRNQVLTQASPMNLGKVNSPNGQFVPVNMTLNVGRESYGTFTIFQGNVIACNVSQPPDIGVVLRGMTANYLSSVLAGLNQSAVTLLSTIVKGVAASLNLPYEFTATDRQIDNYNFSGGLLGQVRKLNLIGGILAYIDPKSNTLVVHDSDKARPGGTILVSANTGMVGIPQVTEVGVIVKVMLAPSYRLGGLIEVVSEINPAANGTYFIYKIDFDVANRDTPFWLTLNCRNLSYFMGTL